MLNGSDAVLTSLSSCVIHLEDKNVLRLFDWLKDEEEHQSRGGELISVGYIYALCGMLVNIVSTKKKDPPTVIGDICGYIEVNTDVRLDTVADHFGYSVEHLSRMFHKEIGISYREYCTKIKMRRAIEMLNDVGKGLLEVALSLGYADESSFIRAFKRIYGVTPSVFKKRRRMIGE